MPGASRSKSQRESAPTSAKLTELDLSELYDLIKGDRYAQAEVWSALEDFRSGDYPGCRGHLESVFGRVGISLQETAKETAEVRAKKIIAKMAADQGKSYKRVATPDLLARTRVKAELQVEKARRIVGAFESVLNRLPSPLAAQGVATQSESGVELSSATTTPDRHDLAQPEKRPIVDPQPPSQRRQGQREVSSDVLLAFKKASSAREARQELQKFYVLSKVDDPLLIQPGALFHLHGGARGNLVRVTSIEKGEVQLEKPHNGQTYKGLVPLAYFLTTGSQGKTHLLVPKREQSRVSPEDQANRSGDEETNLSLGRQDAAVTRASFQLLISDIGRAKQKLQVFSDLHKVRVHLNIDTRTITDADRGSFRKGDRVKARQQAEIIKSQVNAAVNSARASVQQREQEFRQSKDKVAGSDRRPMEGCFAPTYLSLHAVEKAMRNLVQGLDAALSIDKDDAGLPG